MGLQIEFYKTEYPQSKKEIIRSARTARGYTQKYVAQCLGLSVRQYIKYEQGDLDISKMSFEQGINLCELLNIDIYRLITPLKEKLSNP